MIPPRGRSLPPAEGTYLVMLHFSLQISQLHQISYHHCTVGHAAARHSSSRTPRRCAAARRHSSPAGRPAPLQPGGAAAAAAAVGRRQLQRALQGAGKFKPGRVPAALVYHWAEGGGRGRGLALPGHRRRRRIRERQPRRAAIRRAAALSARWRSVRVEAPPSDPEPVSGTADRQTGHRPRHPSAAIKHGVRGSDVTELRQTTPQCRLNQRDRHV